MSDAEIEATTGISSGYLIDLPNPWSSGPIESMRWNNLWTEKINNFPKPTSLSCCVNSKNRRSIDVKHASSGVYMSVCMLSLSSYLLSSSEPYTHILTLTLTHTYTPPSKHSNFTGNWTDLWHFHTLIYTLTHNNTLTPGGP